MHTVKLLQVSLGKTNISTSVIYFQAVKWLNSPISYIIWTLTSTATQSGPRSNRNEEALHITQSSMIEASTSDGLLSYLGHLLGVSYPLQWCSHSILQPQPAGLSKFENLFANIYGAMCQLSSFWIINFTSALYFVRVLSQLTECCTVWQSCQKL